MCTAVADDWKTDPVVNSIEALCENVLSSFLSVGIDKWTKGGYKCLSKEDREKNKKCNQDDSQEEGCCEKFPESKGCENSCTKENSYEKDCCEKFQESKGCQNENKCKEICEP